MTLREAIHTGVACGLAFGIAVLLMAGWLSRQGESDHARQCRLRYEAERSQRAFRFAHAWLDVIERIDERPR